MGFALFYPVLSVRKLNLLSSAVKDPAFYVPPPGLMRMQKYYLEIVFYLQNFGILSCFYKESKIRN